MTRASRMIILQEWDIDTHIPNTHYVVVRGDLPRGTGAAMLVHAAALSSVGTQPNTHVVVLEAPSKTALEKLEKSLTFEQVEHVAFREPDPPWNGQLMSVGINPVNDRRRVRRFFKQFKLLGENHEKLSMEERP